MGVPHGSGLHWRQRDRMRGTCQGQKRGRKIASIPTRPGASKLWGGRGRAGNTCLRIHRARGKRSERRPVISRAGALNSTHPETMSESPAKNESPGVPRKPKCQQRKTIIITRGKREPFTIVPNRIWEDTRLTGLAKSTLGYLIGKPADWKIRVTDVANKGPEGEKAVRSAIALLRATGYMHGEQIKDASGKVEEWVWIAADAPIFGVNQPHAVSAHVDSRHLTKKEGTKNQAGQKNESRRGNRIVDTSPPPAYREPIHPAGCICLDCRRMRGELKDQPLPRKGIKPDF